VIPFFAFAPEGRGYQYAALLTTLPELASPRDGGKGLGMQRHSDPPCPLSEQKFLPSARGYLAAELHTEFASGIKIAQEPKPHCQN